MKPRGWVYAITNPLFDGLVKIGFSMKDPRLRASEGFDPAGLPDAFVVEYMAFVEEPRVIEQLCHTVLSEHHYNKEWFRISVGRAAEAIVSVVANRGSAIVFETERPSDPLCYFSDHSLQSCRPSQNKVDEKNSIPKVRFVHDYLGWESKRKLWALKAVAKLKDNKWVLEVTERFDESQIARSWIAESVEELKAYCRQHSLNFESFSPGKMNPVLGQTKSSNTQ